MSDLLQSVFNSSTGVAVILLALSGAIFLLYVLTILILIGWQKVHGR